MKKESLRVGTLYPWDCSREASVVVEFRRDNCPLRACQEAACCTTYCTGDCDRKCHCFRAARSCQMEYGPAGYSEMSVSDFVVPPKHGDVFFSTESDYFYHDPFFEICVVEVLDYPATKIQFHQVADLEDSREIRIPSRLWLGHNTIVNWLTEMAIIQSVYFRVEDNYNDVVWKEKYVAFDTNKTLPMLVPLLKKIHPCFTRDIAIKVAWLAVSHMGAF